MELTMEKANELLDRAVAEKGEEFEYNVALSDTGSCSYFHGTEPGCIVGHILSYLGLTAENFQERRGLGDFNQMTNIRELKELGFLSNHGIEADDEVIDFLFRVQSMQDSHTPWGEAVLSARNQI